MALIEDGGNPPSATDISVGGKLYVGASIKAEYTFYDEDYDNETDTLIEWYADGVLVKSGVGEGALVLDILKEYEGKSLKLVITPHSDGETAVSYTHLQGFCIIFRDTAKTEELSPERLPALRIYSVRKQRIYLNTYRVKKLWRGLRIQPFRRI